MRISRPRHATVVAYLALFAALGGTAIAARDDIGAKELKRPMIRERSISVDPSNSGNIEVVAGCKRREQLLSGAAGWDGSRPAGPTALVSIELGKGTVTANGSAPNQSNTLTVQAVCLPR